MSTLLQHLHPEPGNVSMLHAKSSPELMLSPHKTPSMWSPGASAYKSSGNWRKIPLQDFIAGVMQQFELKNPFSEGTSFGLGVSRLVH